MPRPPERQETLPDGLFVDPFGGQAYLGIVPFFMENIRPLFLPAVPGAAHGVRRHSIPVHARRVRRTAEAVYSSTPQARSGRFKAPPALAGSEYHSRPSGREGPSLE